VGRRRTTAVWQSSGGIVPMPCDCWQNTAVEGGEKTGDAYARKKQEAKVSGGRWRWATVVVVCGGAGGGRRWPKLDGLWVICPGSNRGGQRRDR